MSWSDCSHIALASSFGASLLAGKRVPIDHSDAAGMNLMDLSHRRALLILRLPDISGCEIIV